MSHIIDIGSVIVHLLFADTRTDRDIAEITDTCFKSSLQRAKIRVGQSDADNFSLVNSGCCLRICGLLAGRHRSPLLEKSSWNSSGTQLPVLL